MTVFFQDPVQGDKGCIMRIDDMHIMLVIEVLYHRKHTVPALESSIAVTL